MDYRLTVKPKTIKLLEENVKENLCDIGLGKDFLDMMSKTWLLKERNG